MVQLKRHLHCAWNQLETLRPKVLVCEMLVVAKAVHSDWSPCSQPHKKPCIALKAINTFRLRPMSCQSRCRPPRWSHCQAPLPP
mmetsp:Transcript_97176/g.173110  ORF Transcript_97176/g.173110 Transcript_97176/m.173110 type:complete len:84 (-) Transcript_97176:199-450(-)